MSKLNTRKKKKSRQEINDECRLLKKKRKHKGLPSGHRQIATENKQQKINQLAKKDARIGSKKPIPLITDKMHSIPVVNANKSVKMTLTLEQELEKLENDTKLERLLDRIDLGEKLTTQEQRYLERNLARIDELMTLLGYEYDELHEQPEQEDIMKLLRQ
ncbi:MAG: GTPase-activating protein [Candidatus Schmidhempelia sp.]|nr:GTPase-activating protein [Candidatus Schmidhempelia sp.]